MLLRQRIKCSKFCHFHLSSFDRSSSAYMAVVNFWRKSSLCVDEKLRRQLHNCMLIAWWRIKPAFTCIFLIVLFCYRYIVMPHVAYRLSLNLVVGYRFTAWERHARNLSYSVRVKNSRILSHVLAINHCWTPSDCLHPSYSVNQQISSHSHFSFLLAAHELRT